jgi:hypothetical protein
MMAAAVDRCSRLGSEISRLRWQVDPETLIVGEQWSGDRWEDDGVRGPAWLVRRTRAGWWQRG